MGRLKLLKVNGLLSIQDQGRQGVRRYGIPASGVMDLSGARLANYLLNNNPDAPVLEFALNGFIIEAIDHVKVAFGGAEAKISINQVSTNESVITLKPKDTLTVHAITSGVYGYMAISGEIKAKKDFESFSTYPLAKLGGINGEYLKKNDEIEFSTAQTHPISTKPEPNDASHLIRMMKGPEWHILREHPELKTFKISPKSNRMAISLKGEPLAHDHLEIMSSAVIPGIIQLLPSGMPTILMKDCQTTGGYPRIAKVMDIDLGKLAQRSPGTSVKFQVVDYDYKTK